MPSLSSRKRKVAADDDGDDTQSQGIERDEDEDDLAEEHHTDVDTDAHGSTNIDDMVKGLVRLALAAELQRRPLRRQEIGEKVLGSHGRSFKKIFVRTQEELRAVFGMELVELPAKERLTAQQKRLVQQKTDNAKPASAWILCSVLPEEYRVSTATTSPVATATSNDARYTAIYTLLVAMVSLNGGALTEPKMDRYLARLDLEDNTPVSGFEKTEKLLKRLERDGYLVKTRESVGTGGEEEVSWTVGPRGKVEIGDAGVQGLVEAMYGDLAADDAAELVKRTQRSLGVNERAPPTSVAKEKKKPSQTKAKRAAATQHSDNDD